MRTYAKTTTRLDGIDRTSTVSVEEGDGKVLVRSDDDAWATGHLDRRSCRYPVREARKIERGLRRTGYRRTEG
jgi:hypothetical protein